VRVDNLYGIVNRHDRTEVAAEHHAANLRLASQAERERLGQHDLGYAASSASKEFMEPTNGLEPLTC
jgi:hypothetical protein